MAGSMADRGRAAPHTRPHPATAANHVPLLPHRQVADLEDIDEGGGEPPAEDEEESTFASSRTRSVNNDESDPIYNR